MGILRSSFCSCYLVLLKRTPKSQEITAKLNFPTASYNFDFNGCKKTQEVVQLKHVEKIWIFVVSSLLRLRSNNAGAF